MADGYSKDSLLEFLDFLKNKGLMNQSTAVSRKAAVNALFGILSDAEAEDIRAIDIDEVARRFSNLQGSKFKPESIRVYKSRVSSAVEDLKRYRENPLNFKANVSANPATAARADKTDGKVTNRPRQTTSTGDNQVAFPIPIRADCVVKLIGVPSDLSRREATKIANVVMALAQED